LIATVKDGEGNMTDPELGDIVYAKFERINLKDDINFSKLELNVHGTYLEFDYINTKACGVLIPRT
jgi:hypothetical protein